MPVFSVGTSRPFSSNVDSEELRFLAEDHNGQVGDTGAGFGRRDEEFLFPTHSDAMNFIRAVQNELPEIEVDPAPHRER